MVRKMYTEEQVFIFVAAFALFVILVFYLYRRLKPYLCCQRTLDQGDNNAPTLSERTSRRPFLRNQPELIVENYGETKVGDTFSFKITLPQSRRSLLSFPLRNAAPSEPTIHPSPNSILMNRDIKIDIRKAMGIGTGDQETITCVREFCVNLENEDFLLVKFSVREAGNYEIHVQYQDTYLPRSPLIQRFAPSTLDPDKSNLVRKCPTMICITGSENIMLIEPRDRFGNICRLEEIDLSDFVFKVTHMDESFKDQVVEAMVYDFSPYTTSEFGLNRAFIQLRTEIFTPGFFRGTVYYRDKLIGNGVFELVSLTADENNILNDSLKKTPGSVYYEAKLLAINCDVQKKTRNIFIYVTAKFILVKEYFLSILPFRLVNYRVIPATKIQLLFVNMESKQCTFTIHDRVQSKLTMEMDITSFRIVTATFAHYLQKRLGGSESFENKQKFFYEELRMAREDKDRLFATISVFRDNLVDSSMIATKGFGVKDWCRKLKINFVGEEGSDDGGLRREWLDLLCVKMFDNNPKGMFACIGTSRLVHPNSNRDKEWTLRHYEFAGKIVGKCLFETSVGGFYKQMVNGRFSRSFLAQLIGSSPQHKHFEQDDPELHVGKIKYILENDVDPMELYFQEEEYDPGKGFLIKTVELVPNGHKIPVTNENREEYLTALAQYRLGTRVQKEVESFLKGLNEIIPDGLLSNFDENELEILMCGKSNFDVEDLKRHHVVTDTSSGDSALFKILPWFFNSVALMSDAERGRLLQFTTGSSLLPHGGFRELQPTFRITLSNTEGKLPIAHTCFSEICLSMHKSFEEFNKSLLTAVNECSEGFALM